MNWGLKTFGQVTSCWENALKHFSHTGDTELWPLRPWERYDLHTPSKSTHTNLTLYLDRHIASTCYATQANLFEEVHQEHDKARNNVNDEHIRQD